MRRAKTQRPKARSSTHAEKRRASSSIVASAPFGELEIDQAIDALDALDQLEIEVDPVTTRPARAGARAEPIDDGPQRSKDRHFPAARVPLAGARGVSDGETPADDLVVEELVPMRSLAIAVYDGAPHVATARSAIAAAGHSVASGATGREGLEQIRHALRTGTVDVLLVGIPGGETLIETALALASRRPIVIASCTGSAADAVRRALDLGADLVTVRPHDLERLAPVLLAAGRLCDERHDATTAKGSEEVLRARLEALTDPELGSLQPFELFQRVLELELKRASRYEYPLAVALFAIAVEADEGDAASAPLPGIRNILRARAGNALIQAIRDVDMATEVDQERFLVLLPYTDLAGAAEVARRITLAVTAGDPVVSAGRRFSSRIVGGVAGAAAGETPSFDHLMRDATAALEEAQRAGGELVVERSEDP